MSASEAKMTPAELAQHDINELYQEEVSYLVSLHILRSLWQKQDNNHPLISAITKYVDLTTEKLAQILGFPTFEALNHLIAAQAELTLQAQTNNTLLSDPSTYSLKIFEDNQQIQKNAAAGIAALKENIAAKITKLKSPQQMFRDTAEFFSGAEFYDASFELIKLSNNNLSSFKDYAIKPQQRAARYDIAGKAISKSATAAKNEDANAFGKQLMQAGQRLSMDCQVILFLPSFDSNQNIQALCKKVSRTDKWFATLGSVLQDTDIIIKAHLANGLDGKFEPELVEKAIKISQMYRELSETTADDSIGALKQKAKCKEKLSHLSIWSSKSSNKAVKFIGNAYQGLRALLSRTVKPIDSDFATMAEALYYVNKIAQSRPECIARAAHIEKLSTFKRSASDAEGNSGASRLLIKQASTEALPGSPPATPTLSPPQSPIFFRELPKTTNKEQEKLERESKIKDWQEELTKIRLNVAMLDSLKSESDKLYRRTKNILDSIDKTLNEINTPEYKSKILASKDYKTVCVGMEDFMSALQMECTSIRTALAIRPQKL